MDKNLTLHGRHFGMVALCENALTIGGRKKVPDASKAYVEFTLARPFPVVSAYGTCTHPGTIGNSWMSMEDQLFDFAHRIKSYDTSPGKDTIHRDYALGSVVGVEFPNTPLGGWRMGLNKDVVPAIRGVAVIHKALERVPALLAEHLGGRHKWTVSLEMDYSLLESGFVIANRSDATKTQEAVLSATSPKDFTELGLGYVPIEQAPDDLFECFDLKQRRIKSQWGKLPVVLMQGGINGSVHFRGVGMVRYGAEREAEIQTLLATDPDQLYDLSDADLGHVLNGVSEFQNNLKKTLDAVREFCSATGVNG